MNKLLSIPEAKNIGKQIGIDFNRVNLNEFRAGLLVEQEHGSRDPQTNVTNDDLILTAKIAWAHLKELPDYYTMLAEIEKKVIAVKGDPTMKKLYLSTKDKKISGVCGGIAEYFETDSAMVRLAWIVLTVLTGIIPGIVGYFIAAVIIPHHLAAN